MSEIAIVSSRKIRLQGLADTGSRGAQVALDLSDNPSRFFSTVQVGITLIGIFNGAFGEAALVADLAPQVAEFPAFAAYSREIALGVVVVGITFASLIFGELVPKRIAMQHPEAVAAFLAVPMQWLSRLMAPFVRTLTFSTDFILKILGIRQYKESSVTEEEFAGMLQEGTNAGIFEKTEHDIVSRALRLDDQRVAALMTPRMDVHFIDLEEPIEVSLAKIAESSYSRFPVCKGDVSHVVGVVHAGNLFDQTIRNKSMEKIDIAAAIRPPLFVPETISAMQLLETLRKNRAELALVVDEYGEIEGIVTLSDVLGALVGDVSVIDEKQEADAVQREDGTWLVDGGISLDRFREVLSTDIRFPEEESGTYHTLAGFVLTQLGRIPLISENFEWEGYRIEVVDMDRNRIDRLLIAPVASTADQNATSSV